MRPRRVLARGRRRLGYYALALLFDRFVDRVRRGESADDMLEAGIINAPLDSLSLRREEMTMKMLGLGQKLPFPGKRDLRGSAAFRREMVRVGVRRALNSLAAGAERVGALADAARDGANGLARGDDDHRQDQQRHGQPGRKDRPPIVGIGARIAKNCTAGDRRDRPHKDRQAHRRRRDQLRRPKADVRG